MTHVVIAGAGIGGLTAALSLAQVGVAVTLIERSPALRDIGAGLQLSPNATAILRDLGLLDAIKRTAVAPRGIRVRGARSGSTLSRLPLDDAEARWGAPYLVAHRADLQAVLVEAVDREPAIALHLGTALAGFGTTEAGVAVTAKQGVLTRAFEGAALIGADGVRSAVRARLVAGAADAPTQTGRTAWRALVPSHALDQYNRQDETVLWLGANAHLVHYPVRRDAGRGDLINVVAVMREPPVDPDADTLWALPGDAGVIAERFKGWHPDARRLIGAAPAWHCWPLYDRAPLTAWNAGPIALLGDAAHPVLPFLAQGAAQAIEDADALGEAFRETVGWRPIPDRLAAYSAARLERAMRVQQTARQLGRIYHLQGAAALARNFGMRMLGSRRLLARYDWLYGKLPHAAMRS